MLIKVCGMRDSANINEVAALKPDLLGFIFYPKSKRYVGEDFDPGLVQSLQPEIETVGVFVNEDSERLTDLAKQFRFDYLQLHGNESPEYCRQAQCDGFKILKAFGISPGFNWDILKPYEDVCDYFLFDTSTKDFGGSGQKFDWALLDDYKLSKPFLLSGGIGPDDSAVILGITHPGFAGIDINSRFETVPGYKNINTIELFFAEIRTKH